MKADDLLIEVEMHEEAVGLVAGPGLTSLQSSATGSRCAEPVAGSWPHNSQPTAFAASSSNVRPTLLLGHALNANRESFGNQFCAHREHSELLAARTQAM